MFSNFLFTISMVVQVAAKSRYHSNWRLSAKSPVYVPSPASEGSPNLSAVVTADRRVLGTSPAWVMSSDDSPQSSPVAIVHTVVQSEIGWPTHPTRDNPMLDDDAVDELAAHASPAESPTSDSEDESYEDVNRRVLGRSPAMTASMDDSPNSAPNASPVTISSEISNDEFSSSSNLKAGPSSVMDSLLEELVAMEEDDDDLVGESPSFSEVDMAEVYPSLSLDHSPVDEQPSVGTSPSSDKSVNDFPSTSNDDSPAVNVDEKKPSYLGDEDRRILIVVD